MPLFAAGNHALAAENSIPVDSEIQQFQYVRAMAAGTVGPDPGTIVPFACRIEMQPVLVPMGAMVRLQANTGPECPS